MQFVMKTHAQDMQQIRPDWTKWDKLLDVKHSQIILKYEFTFG